MEIEFDPDKDATNIGKHGISLARAVDFRMTNYEIVSRNGERRIYAVGMLDGLIYSMTFTFRRNACRVINLRRARREELR